MQNFHDKEDCVALTQPLVQNIMKSQPSEVRPSFNDQFSKFLKQCPANVRPPAPFRLLAQFVEELEKNYRSTPYLYDLDFSPPNVGVYVVRQGTSKPNPQPLRFSGPQPCHPPRPCAMDLKLTIFPSPAPVVLSSWAHPKSLSWLPIRPSVLHVLRLTASATSAKLPTTAVYPKCVPKVA